MGKGYFRNSIVQRVDEYLLDILPPRDPVLAEMEAYGIEHDFPFIGPLVGELLGLLARGIRARTCFELGSGYGFSALHIARALAPDGKVVCTDNDEENAKLAEQFFKKAGLLSKLDFRVGDALTILKDYAGPFDFMLMDIDKEDYPRALEEAWPKLSVGGLFIADNLLWKGRVWGDNREPSTLAMRRYTEMLYSLPDARTTILPLRDGISVTLKVADAAFRWSK
jgi:caffeoyl-CoA O-methyltransferase